MKKPQRKRRRIALSLLFSVFFTLFVSFPNRTQTAYGAECPEKGNEAWLREYYCGCYSCGGDSHVAYGAWERGYNQDATGRYLTDERAGVGFIHNHYETWRDGEGNVYTNVDVYYRCYNCGYISYDGTIYNKNSYQVWKNVIYFTGTDSVGDVHGKNNPIFGPQYESNGGSGLGPGAVPWYFCSFCDGKNVGNYKHEACYTITAAISDAKAGQVVFHNGTAGRSYGVERSGTTISCILGAGAEVDITVQLHEGYELKDWSTGEKTETVHLQAYSDSRITANIKENATTSPIPTPDPTKYRIMYQEEYYRDGVLLYTNISGIRECSPGAVLDNTTLYCASRTYLGSTYTWGGIRLEGGGNLTLSVGEKYAAVTGTVTADAVITRTFFQSGQDCEHDYRLEYNTTHHYEKCTVCGNIRKEELHSYVSVGDGNGNDTYTCTVCGYTYTAHRHDWILYDYNETHHWAFCLYCDEITKKGLHVKGNFADEGDGYYVARCKVCQYPMEKLPVTVDLYLHPGGGTWADGTSEVRLLTGFRYGFPSAYATLGSDYVPVKGMDEFIGFAIVAEELEEYVYYYNKDSGILEGWEALLPNGVSYLKKTYTAYAQYRDAEYLIEYDGNGADGWTRHSYHRMGVPAPLTKSGFWLYLTMTYETGREDSIVFGNRENREIHCRFLGWARTPDGAVVYQEEEVVTNVRDTPGTVCLYARWEGCVPLPDAYSPGYRLIGWRTGGGTAISVLDENGAFTPTYYYTDTSERFTALWKANTYTVDFDLDYDAKEDAPASIQVEYGQCYGHLPTVSRPGWRFKGWKYAHTGARIEFGSVVEIPGDHTLTAVWEPSLVRVEFDYNFDYGLESEGCSMGINPNAGSRTQYVLSSNKSFCLKTYDEEFGELPMPERDGYVFCGWYLEEFDGNGCEHYAHLVGGTTLVVQTATIRLYARWEADRYRVILDPNLDYSVWTEP